MTDKQTFESFASQKLNETIAHMDHNTATRLSIMRHAAVASTSYRRQNWFMLAAMGAAMTAFLLVWMMPAPEKPGPDLAMPEGQTTDEVMEDMDLLASEIGLELLEDIEFYQWLESSTDAG